MSNADFPTKEEYEFILRNSFKEISAKIKVLQEEAAVIATELYCLYEERENSGEQNNQKTVHEVQGCFPWM